MQDDEADADRMHPSRRALLIQGGWLTAGLLAMPALATRASAQLPMPSAQTRAMFMALSRRLTERQDLDLDLGVALLQGILASTTVTPEALTDLQQLSCAQPELTAQAWAEVTRQRFARHAHTIDTLLTAWYRGITGERVIVYASAMMFTVVRDGIAPKTYAYGAPFNWTAPPPPVARQVTPPSSSPASGASFNVEDGCQ